MFAKAKNPYFSSFFFSLSIILFVCVMTFAQLSIFVSVHRYKTRLYICNTILIPKVSVISSRKCDSRCEQVYGVNAIQ